MEISLIGAGTAALSLAKSMMDNGVKVNLFARNTSRVNTDFSTKYSHKLTLNDDVSKAFENNVILVAISSDCASSIVEKHSSQLRADQNIILIPGHTGGVWELSYNLQHIYKLQLERMPNILQMQLPFICRLDADGYPVILQRKNYVNLACDTSDYKSKKMQDILNDAGFSVRNIVSVLEDSLTNITLIVQPTLMFMNLVKIEKNENFKFYSEGMTKSVESLMKAIDRERIAVGKAYSMNLMPVENWFREHYGSASSDSLVELVREVEGYKNVSSPGSTDHRFLIEHVKTGLVPLLKLASNAGVSCPISESLVNLISETKGENMMKIGRKANIHYKYCIN